jgi:transcriptional regulator with XRE-family HTH domain
VPDSADAALQLVSKQVDVGERLREIRHTRRLTLLEVAERAGVSESFLSQVERGRSNASIASLQRIAGALGYGIGDLFGSGSERPQIMRRADRPALALGAIGTKYLLTPPPFENVEIAVAELPPGGSTGDEPYVHGDSEELVVVIYGQVVAQVDGVEHMLHPGDSIRYRSSAPHRLANVGKETAEVLWVVSPPSY